MVFPRRTWLVAALGLTALAGFAPEAQASKHKHHAQVHHARHMMAPAPRHAEMDLGIGSGSIAGEGHNYFSDSRAPAYNLGPSLFQRFQ